MPDIKDYPPDQREAFIAGLDATLTKYGLMDNALFIGRKEIAKPFMGRARVSTSESPERLANSDREHTDPTSDRQDTNPAPSSLRGAPAPRHCEEHNDEAIWWGGKHPLNLQPLAQTETLANSLAPGWSPGGGGLGIWSFFTLIYLFTSDTVEPIDKLEFF